MPHSGIQLSGVFTTLLARGGAAFGGLLLSMVVARLVGAEGLGRFTVFISLLGAAAILARRGQDSLLMRAVAWSETRGRRRVSVGLLYFGLVRILLPVCVLGGLGVILLHSGALGPPFPGSVIFFPIALLLLTALALVAGYAKGLSRAWVAPIFEIGGVSLIAAAILAVALFAQVGFSAEAAIGAFVAALILLSLSAAAMVLRDAPRLPRLTALKEADRSELQSGQVAFTLIVLSGFLMQAGSFLLAAPFLSEVDLGLVRAAERLALLVSFPFLAISPVVAPRIVNLSRSGEVMRLRHLMTSAVILTAMLGAPVMLILVLWPQYALTLMGPEFVRAADYLRVLAIVHLLVGAVGPLAVRLNMSGREHVMMWINLAAFGSALILIPALSHLYGAIGFVAAYSVAALLRGVLILSCLFDLRFLHLFSSKCT